MPLRAKSLDKLPENVRRSLREQGVELEEGRAAGDSQRPGTPPSASPEFDRAGWGFWRGVQLAVLGYALLIVARLLGVL